MGPRRQLALYTQIYPGVERFLPAWYESVIAQTDRNFDVWIGTDRLDADMAIRAMGGDPSATWVKGSEGDSATQIRQAAIARMVTKYPAVVFVDSDDVLGPTRVEGARMALEKSDVTGCAADVIDEAGYSLGIRFAPPTADVSSIITRCNVYGMSNSAYRCETLARCLPIPSDCVLVDWYLVTRAWTQGAVLHFDFEPRMSYRQYSSNTAGVVQPFSAQQVVTAGERVLRHYALVMEHTPNVTDHYRVPLETAQKRAQAFYYAVTHSSEILAVYLEALNELPLDHIWWECVAHPRLEGIWQRS